MKAAQRSRDNVKGMAGAVGPQAAPYADATISSPRALRQFLRQQI